MTFGRRVKLLRLEKRLTQQQCADRAGIDRTTWAGYESGKNRMPQDEKVLIRMAKILGTSVDYLIGNTDDKRPIDELKEQLEQFKDQVPDLLTYAKLKRPTFRGRPISEEEAKELNKIFDIFLDLLEAKMEKNAKNVKSGMIDNAS